MSDQSLIQIENDKCVICFACVKACPVKAIQVVHADEPPKVIDDRCIGCGNCVFACAPNAVGYRKTIDEANQILSSDNFCVVMVSPSIAGEFEDITDYRKFVQMIKELGFDKVHEVSFGVDLIAHRYLDHVNDFKGKYTISSHDPVVVSYIEKYKPRLINNLIPLVTPHIAMAKVVRTLYSEKENLKIVYISPDLISKDEVFKYNGDFKIDCVLTFNELREMFDTAQLNENFLEYSDFDQPLGYKGSLYPIANGILQAADVDENIMTSAFITVEGEKSVIKAFNEFEKFIDLIQRHLNVTFGNALMGAGMSRKHMKLIRENLVINYANKRLQNFFRVEWQEYLDQYYQLDYTAKFVANDQKLPIPEESKTRAILHELGKSEDDNIGCGECGYSSCKEFAIAVAQGLTTREMCSAYNLKNKLNKSDSLLKTSEELTRLKKDLKEAKDSVINEKAGAAITTELIDALLLKLRAGIIITNRDLKITHSNKAFVNILGEDVAEVNDVIPGLVGADLTKLVPYNIHSLFTYVLDHDTNIDNRDIQLENKLLNVTIFVIRKGRMAGGIIRDMSAPEVQRFEVVNRLTEVIDKNLGMVQQIAFLLGEGASDVEKMLNSIIEFYKKEE